MNKCKNEKSHNCYIWIYQVIVFGEDENILLKGSGS